jgi:uroporphyrinogen III methyltransferase/synthase
MTGRLASRRIVVTRAREQASELVRALEAEGATAIEVPVIAVAPASDGGAALRAALSPSTPRGFDWIVVTSPNGADVLATVARPSEVGHAQLAAVGPGTAARLAVHGFDVALVPDRFVAEALVAAFPDPRPDGTNRVLLAQAEKARPVLAEGLRARGWDVVPVVAYRTVAARPSEEALAQLASADAITFTASSTVDNFVDAYGVEAVPPFVACIGPITAATAADRRVPVSIVAEPHTIDGLVAALVDALGTFGAGATGTPAP